MGTQASGHPRPFQNLPESSGIFRIFEFDIPENGTMGASTVAYCPLQGVACWGLVSLLDWEVLGVLGLAGHVALGCPG